MAKKKEPLGGLPGLIISKEMIEWFKIRWEYMRRDPEFNPEWGDKSKTFEELCQADDITKLMYAYHFIYEAHSIKVDNKQADKITIEIDFNKVNSIDDLKKHLKQIISEYWLHYISKNKTTMHKEQKNYDLILKVGTMKESNLTNMEIGNKLFPGHAEGGESGEKTAARYYREYKKLVNGGWRRLTYP